MSNLLLLKYAIHSLLYRRTNKHFRCRLHIQENHIQIISYHHSVFIILYNLWLLSCLFPLCKSFNMYALAETHVVCVTTTSPFLSCQVYIPRIIHIIKRSPKNLNPRLVMTNRNMRLLPLALISVNPRFEFPTVFIMKYFINPSTE